MRAWYRDITETETERRERKGAFFGHRKAEYFNAVGREGK